MSLQVDSTGNLDKDSSPKPLDATDAIITDTIITDSAITDSAITDEVYHLRLYIMGISRHSMQALTNLKRVCEQYLPERYELEVIDLERQREPVASDGFVVAPMVVKNFPLPVRKLVGNLANTQELLRRFDIASA